jgi:TonB family protein
MGRMPNTSGWPRRLGKIRGDVRTGIFPPKQWQGVLWPATLEGRIATSAVIHGIVVFLFFNSWWLGARHLKPAGTSAGSHVMMAYHPGKPTPPRLVHHIQVTRRYPRAVAIPVIQAETPKTPETSGNDAQGSGTVSIAYVESFPRQRPDLSNAGATGEVVIDVEIDNTGHVAQVHARKGMGRGIDDMVVATVERWVFYPAMRNGHAVSSERELHFHFDRRRDANCGWECFALEGQ